MSAVCRNRRSTKRIGRTGEGGEPGAQRWSTDRNCFSPIRRHYHAPSCSNGSVKCQTGELSVLLCPALRSAPTVAKTPPSPLVLTASVPPPSPQRCDCAAKLWLLFLLPCPCPCSLYIAIVLWSARALFFKGVRVYGECVEKGERQLARREKRQDSRERNDEREREREREKERITVISVDNAMSKHNDATFAR